MPELRYYTEPVSANDEVNTMHKGYFMEPLRKNEPKKKIMQCMIGA